MCANVRKAAICLRLTSRLPPSPVAKRHPIRSICLYCQPPTDSTSNTFSFLLSHIGGLPGRTEACLPRSSVHHAQQNRKVHRYAYACFQVLASPTARIPACPDQNISNSNLPVFLPMPAPPCFRSLHRQSEKHGTQNRVRKHPYRAPDVRQCGSFWQWRPHIHSLPASR